jgi:hypothetical protein
MHFMFIGEVYAKKGFTGNVDNVPDGAGLIRPEYKR